MKRRTIKSPVAERVVLTGDAENASYEWRRGILEGSLEPLADYLAAGHPMDHVLRRELIDAIEGRAGDGLFTLKLCKNRSGAGTNVTKRRTLRKHGEIVTYFRLLDPAQKYASRVDDTAKHFGIGATQVKDALAAASGNASESGESGK